RPAGRPARRPARGSPLVEAAPRAEAGPLREPPAAGDGARHTVPCARARLPARRIRPMLALTFPGDVPANDERPPTKGERSEPRREATAPCPTGKLAPLPVVRRSV